MNKTEQRAANLRATIHTILTAAARPMTVKQIAFEVPCSIMAVERAVESDRKLMAFFINGKIAISDIMRGRHRWLSNVKNTSNITYFSKEDRAITIPLPERLNEIIDPSIRAEVENDMVMNRAAAVRESSSPAKIVASIHSRDAARLDAALRQQYTQARLEAEKANTLVRLSTLEAKINLLMQRAAA